MRRRTLLKAGLAGGALLAVGGIAVVAGRDPVRDRRAVLSAVAPAILHGALPAQGDARSAAIARSVAAVEAAIARLAPAAQADLGRLFALLGSAPGRLALARLRSPWESASVPEVAAFLEHWRHHPMALLRTGYQALHDLVLGSWYADEASWAAIGYDGPPKL